MRGAVPRRNRHLHDGRRTIFPHPRLTPALPRNSRHRAFFGMCQNPPPGEEGFLWNQAMGQE